MSHSFLKSVMSVDTSIILNLFDVCAGVDENVVNNKNAFFSIWPMWSQSRIICDGGNVILGFGELYIGYH